MCRPHHPDRRPPAEHVTTPAPEDDFGNAVFTVADLPPDIDTSDAITISLDDMRLCGAEPLRLVVLMAWRFRARDGLPCGPEAIWASLTKRGTLDADGMSPLHLDDVTRVLAFLDRSGVLVVPR
ncbi:MAG TPA: hypothetical protein DD420_10165 [Streptomyces sp.]|nr:hypothetical protein [Streptomyces sp.]